MFPGKEIDLYNIISQLITPALREIQDFVHEYRAKRTCRDFYGMSYHNIYYYLRKLCRKRKILPLVCDSGYKKRYCINTDVKSRKRRLHSCVKFMEGENGKYIYGIGIEDLVLDFGVKVDQIESRNGTMFITLCDRELSRHYIVRDSVFLGVIRWEDKVNPRLPGSTYGYGTEYSRCLSLFKKHGLSHRILSLIGHRTVTGRTLT